MRKIIFKNFQSPGDIMMLQLAVRELHRNYPNQFITDIVSPYPEITYGNFLLTRLIVNGMKDEDAEIIDVGYVEELIRSKISGSHFSDGFIADINNKLNLNIVKENMYPPLYLKDHEKDVKETKIVYNLPERFWIFNAGIKNDIPLKSWVVDYWKEFIQLFNKKSNIFLVQVGSHNHIHPNFNNDVISLVGKTENLREFIRVCYAAEGSIGPISMHMHLMASFKKPCIVIAGGRELSTWEQYPIHQFLHTVGTLDCCKLYGCHKSQRSECVNIDKSTNYPKCMSMIDHYQVWKAFRMYEKNGSKI